jgi:hypothetical protein
LLQNSAELFILAAEDCTGEGEQNNNELNVRLKFSAAVSLGFVENWPTQSNTLLSNFIFYVYSDNLLTYN